MREVKQKKALDVPPYSGWRPRSMRMRSRGGSDPNRDAKRSQLGTKADKMLYCSSRGYKNEPNRYAEICARVDTLKGNQRSSG